MQTKNLPGEFTFIILEKILNNCCKIKDFGDLVFGKNVQFFLNLIFFKEFRKILTKLPQISA